MLDKSTLFGQRFPIRKEKCASQKKGRNDERNEKKGEFDYVDFISQFDGGTWKRLERKRGKNESRKE